MTKISGKGFKGSVGHGGSASIRNTSVQFGNSGKPCADDKGSRGASGTPGTKGAAPSGPIHGPKPTTPSLDVGLARGDGQKQTKLVK